MGRPAQVDRASIAAAAVEVGFEDLSVSSVARHLGVKHSTLYRYFATREDLVAAAVDEVVVHARWPQPSDDWEQYLRGVGTTTFRLLQQHPGLALQISSLRVGSAELARQGLLVAAALLEHGFGPRQAILAQDLVNEQALLFFLAGQRLGEPTMDARGAARLRKQMLDPGVADGDPTIVAAVADVVAGSPEAWFACKLDVLIAGIATML
jgi:AcrR family transcriptional regulator